MEGKRCGFSQNALGQRRAPNANGSSKRNS